jgi:CubicO group peptidase (beta-lactamase class C family)
MKQYQRKLLLALRYDSRVRYVAITLFCARLFAQDFSAVEQTAREELTRTRVPGASIVLIKGDRVVFTKGAGTANVETGEPVRPEMLFRLGSTTKMFTAGALVGLALEGKLDLNAPIGRYVMGLPPRLSEITANQLLSHTAGIRDEAPMYGSHDDSALATGIHSWTDDWLFTKPGKIYSYSNPGYWMAGYLVELLSGKPYADAVDQRIFQPLGMGRTTLRPLMAMTYPLAQGHEAPPGNVARIARPAADNAASWPAGSIFSNTQDLARFVIAFLNDGRLEGRQVLDPRVIAQLSSTHARYPDSQDSYGYGLTVRDTRGVHILEHGGSRMGYGSMIRMIPEHRAAIIILTNRTGANLPETADRAMELIAPMQPKSPRPQKPVLPISDEDVRRVAGTYRNGDQTLEIVAEGGKLYLKRPNNVKAALSKRSDVRFGAEGIPGDLVMVPGASGKAEFLNQGSRSLARVK